MPETCIRFGELGARVMIEDKEVQHYAMQVDPAKKEVSCWIASEAGKAFSVVWLEFNIEFPCKGKLYLDGHSVRTVRRRDAKPILFQYISISESSQAPFLFSPLDVTDDDTYLDTSPSHSIGEIKLVIVRTTVPDVTAAKEPYIYRSPPHLQKVHERSKKAIAHRVTYGSEIPRRQVTSSSAKSGQIPRSRVTKSSAKSGENSRPRMMTTSPTKIVETLVTFIFKYRPLEMLRANDIVPRNPEPLETQEHALDTSSTSKTSSGKGKHSKVEKVLEFGSEDEDSMREKALLAEVQRCQAQIERIKTEFEGIRKGKHLKDSDRPKKKLKKEDEPLFISGEIIDLT